MAELDKYQNSHHTYPSLKTFLKKEDRSLLQPAGYNTWKLGIILVIVSICACHSTELNQLETKPTKANELEIKPIEVIGDVAPPQHPCPLSQVPADKQAQNNLHTPDRVEKEIKDIKEKAFEFAVATAQGVGNRKERRERAIVMDERLTALYPLIPCVESKQALAITWSKARLDIGYVLSDGKELARPDLYSYVQTLRKQNQEKKDNQ